MWKGMSCNAMNNGACWHLTGDSAVYRSSARILYLFSFCFSYVYTYDHVQCVLKLLYSAPAKFKTCKNEIQITIIKSNMLCGYYFRALYSELQSPLYYIGGCNQVTLTITWFTLNQSFTYLDTFLGLFFWVSPLLLHFTFTVFPLQRVAKKKCSAQ